VVDLRVISGDVIHSWWIPALGGKIMAVPGRTNHTWFRADREGTYVGQCAELCGLYHASMRASVVVTSAQAYRSYVTTSARADLGRNEFVGVCATCHGMHGEGGYGVNLSHNPLLTQTAGLLSVVRNGFLKMPAVGATWTPEQLQALAAYVKKSIYKGATTSGG
jgi:cytochrome c553